MDNHTRKSDIPKTIAEAEEIAARHGITLTAQDYSDMYAVMAERQHQMERQEIVKVRKGWVDKFNRFYPKFLQTLLGIGDVMITGVHTLLIAFGVPILLTALMTVEQQRVYYGAMLIDGREALATGIAWVLVLANLVAELVKHWEEHRQHWKEPARYEFSLRILWQQIAYILGFNSSWSAHEKSPAFWARLILRFITITILMLAVAGSMKDAMNTTGGATWFEAVVFIFTRSTLLQMVTWIGGLALAFTFVIAAQGFSQYVAKKVIEIVAIMQSNAVDKPTAIMDAVGITGAAFLMGRIKEAQKQRRAAAVVAAEMPLSVASGVQSVSIMDNQQTEDATDTHGDAIVAVDKIETKVDRAIELLKIDRSLRKLTTRQLEERFPDIGFRTWATAKNRLK